MQAKNVNRFIGTLAASRPIQMLWLMGGFSFCFHIWVWTIWQTIDVYDAPIVSSQWIEVALRPAEVQHVEPPVQEKPVPTKPEVVEKKPVKDTPKPIVKMPKPALKPVPKIRQAVPENNTPVVTKPEFIAAPLPAPTINVSKPKPIEPPHNENADRDSNGLTIGVVVLKRTPPEYPERALTRGIEGRVTVEFIIKPNGDVANLTIVNAEPSDIFNEAALSAIKQWKFKQKLVNGVAVEQRTRQTLTFKLD